MHFGRALFKTRADSSSRAILRAEQSIASMLPFFLTIFCVFLCDAKLNDDKSRSVVNNITTRHGATVSGISSGKYFICIIVLLIVVGGYMAVQMQIAYSSTFIGAGVFAGMLSFSFQLSVCSFSRWAMLLCAEQCRHRYAERLSLPFLSLPFLSFLSFPSFPFLSFSLGSTDRVQGGLQRDRARLPQLAAQVVGLLRHRRSTQQLEESRMKYGERWSAMGRVCFILLLHDYIF
jgi:hypothetical protein